MKSHDSTCRLDTDNVWLPLEGFTHFNQQSNPDMLREKSLLNIKNLDAKPALSFTAVLFECWVAGKYCLQKWGLPSHLTYHFLTVQTEPKFWKEFTTKEFNNILRTQKLVFWILITNYTNLLDHFLLIPWQNGEKGLSYHVWIENFFHDLHTKIRIYNQITSFTEVYETVS